MKKIYLICILLASIICCHNKGSVQIYYNKSFHEVSDIAYNSKSPFCVVLIDSQSMESKEFMDMIKTDNISSDKLIFNFVNTDIEENKWYSKLLSPQVYPVICVFGDSKTLIDLIPGNSKESFSYLNKVIETREPCLDFHYNQKYDKVKIETIHHINTAIILKLKADNNLDVINELDSLFRVTAHPYLLFCKMQNQLQVADTIAAKETAEELLSFDSAQNLLMYYDEFKVANQLLDFAYNETAPILGITNNQIELANCKIDSSYYLKIIMENQGKKPLKISDILTSCSCVELKSAKRHLINPNESLVLNVEFTPDATGELFREVYIISNSLNTPLYTVTINATVK